MNERVLPSAPETSRTNVCIQPTRLSDFRAPTLSLGVEQRDSRFCGATFDPAFELSSVRNVGEGDDCERLCRPNNGRLRRLPSSLHSTKRHVKFPSDIGYAKFFLGYWTLKKSISYYYNAQPFMVLSEKTSRFPAFRLRNGGASSRRVPSLRLGIRDVFSIPHNRPGSGFSATRDDS